MKKRLAMLLAVLMLASCLSPAWAAEGEAQSDYELLGPYLEWTQEQKTEAFNTWDETRWELYWYGGAENSAGDYQFGYYDAVMMYDRSEAEFDADIEAWEADFKAHFQDFATLGPYGNWTQEQKDDAKENWGMMRWEFYWDAYYASYDWPDTTQYSADYAAYENDMYSVPDCGVSDWEAQWREYIRQKKADMGMPYPDGINVTLNGEFLTLDGVEAVAVENRTMVPVRAFLETLGAEVDYKGGVITAKLENGDSLEMKLDSTILTHTVGDKINETDMGVAPYARDGRTYIPARFAGEALGLSVAWDSEYEVAHFTDWDKIAADIDGNFTVLNALLGAEGEKLDPAKTYAVDAVASGAVTLYGETERDNGTAKLEASAKGLLQGGKMDVTYGMKMDLGKLEEMVAPQMGGEAMSALELLSDFRVQLRGDLGEGSFYLKGNKLDQVSDGAIPSDTWISMDMGQGIDVDAYYEALNAGRETATVGGRLTGFYRDSGYTYGGTPPCAEALDQAKPLDMLFGDANFKTSTAGSTTTYTLKMDAPKLATRMSELAADEAERAGMEEVLAVLTGELKVDYALTVRMRDNKIVDFKLTGDIRLPSSFTGSMPVSLSFALDGDGRNVSGNYTLKGEYIGKLEMNLDMKITDSARAVPTAPAAGEKVVDAEEL